MKVDLLNEKEPQALPEKRKTKGLFVTATGTDMGKTYITALLVRALRQAGYNAGYYKAALSGAESIEESDAGYVSRIAGIGKTKEPLLSYLYKNAVSPHLAAQWEGNPARLEKILRDYGAACSRYDYVTVEGSGGVVCPIRWDEEKHLLLEDIVKALGLGTVVVADSGLGTINAVVLTVEYLRNRQIPVRGIILNRYSGTRMQEDNLRMIEELSGVPVIALVADGGQELDCPVKTIKALYE